MSSKEKKPAEKKVREPLTPEEESTVGGGTEYSAPADAKVTDDTVIPILFL